MTDAISIADWLNEKLREYNLSQAGPSLLIQWQGRELILQFCLTASNRHFIQDCDQRQFTVAWTIRFFGQGRYIPALLWFIQTAQKQVHPVMTLYDFRIKTCFISLALTLVYDWFCARASVPIHQK